MQNAGENSLNRPGQKMHPRDASTCAYLGFAGHARRSAGQVRNSFGKNQIIKTVEIQTNPLPMILLLKILLFSVPPCLRGENSVSAFARAGNFHDEKRGTYPPVMQDEAWREA